MNPRAFGIPLLLLLVACLPAHASKIVPLDLDKLAPQSELIVVGVVTAISDSDTESDTISVSVISALKGKTEAKSFSLRLRNKGVKDFDPTLAVGDQAVFFLKSIEGGRAELTYWGSIAVMPKAGNFSVPGKPDGGLGGNAAAATKAGNEKAPQPAKDSYVKVRVEVEVRGTLNHTDKATTVSARTQAFDVFDEAKEVPGAVGASPFTLDFAEAKHLRELAEALAGREVVVTGKSELRMVVLPPRAVEGGTGGQSGFPMYQPPTWSVQRTVLVTGLKSASK